MPVDLAGQTAIVTGAAGGIGRVIARRLGECGAAVVVADTDTAEGESVVEDLEERGLAARFVECDISSIEQTRALADATVEAFGSVDVLVNNAAVFSEGTITEVEPEYWREHMAVNLDGQYNCASAVADRMVAQGGGNIVNVASMAGRGVGTSHASDYTTSQWGLIGLTKHLAWELGSDGVRANAVCPGLVLTPANRERIPPELFDEWLRHAALDEFPTPEDVANGVLYLASDLAKTVTGTVLEIDSGEQLKKRPIVDEHDFE